MDLGGELFREIVRVAGTMPGLVLDGIHRHFPNRPVETFAKRVHELVAVENESSHSRQDISTLVAVITESWEMNLQADLALKRLVLGLRTGCWTRAQAGLSESRRLPNSSGRTRNSARG